VTFLSDYGLVDEFVGVCHGVIKRIAPEADIVDIAHGISPQHVLQGALVLADSLPYMPIGVHLAVIDPSVGGSRRAIALSGNDGRLYVGPDNGLLLLGVERMGGIASAVEITNPLFMLESVSPTFHGRDVFAPAAAHLARGVPLGELGPAVPPESLAAIELPVARVESGRIQATVIAVDRYGNVRLNLEVDHLADAGIEQGDAVDVEVDGRHYTARAARTFVDVELGQIVLYVDSARSVALAVNRGSAARSLGVVAGQGVTIVRA
jgi:S-adenosylmethionine hydrolase